MKGNFKFLVCKNDFMLLLFKYLLFISTLSLHKFCITENNLLDESSKPYLASHLKNNQLMYYDDLIILYAPCRQKIYGIALFWYNVL